jgi:hypothetical protein
MEKKKERESGGGSKREVARVAGSHEDFIEGRGDAMNVHHIRRSTWLWLMPHRTGKKEGSGRWASVRLDGCWGFFASFLSFF